MTTMTENVKHVDVLQELRKLCDKPNSAYGPALDAAILSLQREAAGDGEGVADRIKACFDGIDLTRHQFNVGGVITRTEDGCGEFYKASAINEAIERINALMADLRNTAPRPTGTDWDHCDKCGYMTRNGAQCSCAPASAEPGETMHCQNGRADVCRASQRDGVVCPDESCDIDDGVRPRDDARGGGEAVWIDRNDLEAMQSGRRYKSVVFAEAFDGDCIALRTHPTPAALDAESRNAARYLWLRDTASRAQLEMFADRSGTRLAADRVCDAGIDIAAHATTGAE